MDKKIRVSTINIAIPHPKSISQLDYRLLQAEKYLNEAGRKRSDIVCLPEAFNAVTGKTPAENSVKMPDSDIGRYIGEKAKLYKMNIIAPVYEKYKGKVYNSSVVFNRKGKIIGRYLKTHLPGEKCEKGVELPVIKTDFGKIGIMTCHDMGFMEIPRAYMLKGAEIVFWPTMWGHEEIPEYTLLYMKAAALLNSVYVVSSDFAWTAKDKRCKPCGSYIVSPNGGVLATKGCKGGLVTADITLYRDFRKYKDTSDCYDPNPGIRRQALLKERRPNLYKIIAKK